jgi:hypothetical protein
MKGLKTLALCKQGSQKTEESAYLRFSPSNEKHVKERDNKASLSWENEVFRITSDFYLLTSDIFH